MDISLILKLTGLGILVSVSCQILKKSGHEEQALGVSVAGMLIGILLMVEKLRDVVTLVRSVFSL